MSVESEGVRCRTARQVLIPSPLTGTDALSLDTTVRPYFKFAE